jgi:hypothetical protein
MDSNNAVMDVRLDGVVVDVILRERVECFPLLNAGSSSADYHLPGPERPCRIQARAKPSFKSLLNVSALARFPKNIHLQWMSVQ